MKTYLLDPDDSSINIVSNPEGLLKNPMIAFCFDGFPDILFIDEMSNKDTDGIIIVPGKGVFFGRGVVAGYDWINKEFLPAAMPIATLRKRVTFLGRCLSAS